MDERGALRFIADALAGGRVEFTHHAMHESMPERGLEIQDVLVALRTATSALLQDDSGTKWKVYGSMTNGDELAVVVRFRTALVVLVITAHNPP